MYICIHIYIIVYIYIYIYIYINMYSHIYIYIHDYINVYFDIYTHTRTTTYVCKCEVAYYHMYVYILLSEICTYLFAYYIYYIYNILIFTFPSEFRPTEPGREHCTPAHNTCCDSFAEFGALEISTTRRTSLLDCKGRTCGFHGAFKHHRNAGFHVVLSCHFQSLWGTYKAT